MRYKVVKPDICEHSCNPKDYSFGIGYNINDAFDTRRVFTVCYRGWARERGCDNCEMEVRIE